MRVSDNNRLLYDDFNVTLSSAIDVVDYLHAHPTMLPCTISDPLIGESQRDIVRNVAGEKKETR